MQCQTGRVVSDYTSLSRYIYHTCSVHLSQYLHQQGKHNDARLTCTSGLCMLTFLWNASVGSHRNSANCSVGKEVVLTSCKNVTLLCSCGCDLIHTHCWKISHFYKRKCVSLHVFKWIEIIRPHCIAQMDEYSFFALHSNEGRFRQTVENHQKSFSSRIFLLL